MAIMKWGSPTASYSEIEIVHEIIDTISTHLTKVSTLFLGLIHVNLANFVTGVLPTKEKYE